MRLLVFEYKVVDFEYFMDKMTIYELDECLRGLIYCDKTLKMNLRYLNYTVMCMCSKDRIKVEDVYKLPWDDERLLLDKETQENAQDMLMQLENIINKKNGS